MADKERVNDRIDERDTAADINTEVQVNTEKKVGACSNFGRPNY